MANNRRCRGFDFLDYRFHHLVMDSLEAIQETPDAEVRGQDHAHGASLCDR